MKWARAWATAALVCFCNIEGAKAQSVLPPILAPGSSTFSSGPEFPPPKPFGTAVKQLPGLRVTNATSIKGKWFHRAIQRNVVLENERVPQVFTSLLLELQPDGHYTLDYQAAWGGVRNASDPRFVGIQARESGRFSLSGGVLLLQAETIELTSQRKGTRNSETLAKENRAYVVSLEKNAKLLHIAGPCTRYQIETLCQTSRNVWFSLLEMDGSRAAPAGGIPPR